MEFSLEIIEFYAKKLSQWNLDLTKSLGIAPGEVLKYMGYIGTCRGIGYGSFEVLGP